MIELPNSVLFSNADVINVTHVTTYFSCKVLLPPLIALLKIVKIPKNPVDSYTPLE